MSDVLVLCYHGVSARWPASLTITPEQLEQQLSFLVRRGYRGATFEQAVLSPRRVRDGLLLRPLEALLRGRPRTAGHERAELE